MYGKLYLFSLLLFIVPVLFTACGPDKKAAVDYNDQIVIEQIKIAEDMKFLFDTFEDFDSTDMADAYIKLTATINNAIEKTDSLKDFDNNTEFRNQAIKLFTSYKTVTENEYKKMIDILNLPDSLYDDTKIAEWDSLNKESINKLNVALKKFNDYQKIFAHNYEISLNDTTEDSKN